MDEKSVKVVYEQKNGRNVKPNNSISTKVYVQYLKLTIGSIIMAFSVVEYFNILHIVPGGVTGIAVILNGKFGIAMWIVNAIINAPLFIIAIKLLRKEALVRTLYSTVILTIFLGVFPVMEVLTGDLLVDVLTGSVIMGFGLGLIFSANASSGGTDLAATLLNKKIAHLSIPKIMACVDTTIMLIGIKAFGLTNAIYAIIGIYAISKVSDYIMEGPNKEKLIYIISDKYEEISEYILNDISRGASYIKLVGVYTKQDRNMIMCVVNAKEMVKIKEKTYQIDENAICFIGDIREAFGEGFTNMIG